MRWPWGHLDRDRDAKFGHFPAAASCSLVSLGWPYLVCFFVNIVEGFELFVSASNILVHSLVKRSNSEKKKIGIVHSTLLRQDTIVVRYLSFGHSFCCLWFCHHIHAGTRCTGCTLCTRCTHCTHVRCTRPTLKYCKAFIETNLYKVLHITVYCYYFDRTHSK